MQWSDEGTVLGARRHGESSAILEVMTREHGRHLGLVRGGAGSRLRPMLQPGNLVGVVWRARLDEHLGHYGVEGLRLRTATMLARAHAAFCVTHLAALCRLLPERDPHPRVYEFLEATLERIDEPAEIALNVVRFELMMLAELGFGLDLDSCAATGSNDDLAYVSPKSARAVSRAAGEPWRDRLLPLPPFLRTGEPPHPPSVEDLHSGFALTGYFLARHVLEPRGETFSDARRSLLAALVTTETAAASG